MLGLLTGHLWIYPPKIAQGWDSSLAYFNYYNLEDQMLKTIPEMNIAHDKIGTHLPLDNLHVANLGLTRKFDPSFANLDLEVNDYILFSNLDNATSDEDVDVVMKSWTPVAHFEKRGVFLTLYRSEALKF